LPEINNKFGKKCSLPCAEIPKVFTFHGYGVIEANTVITNPTIILKYNNSIRGNSCNNVIKDATARGGKLDLTEAKVSQRCPGPDVASGVQAQRGRT
jgi:hypothetical protein